MGKGTPRVGTITKVIEPKGIGLIEPANGGRDALFHCRVLDGLAFTPALVGQKVWFSLDDGKQDRGPKASRVWSVA